MRSWRSSDETSLVKHANNRKVWINLSDLFPHPYTLADARAWIRSNEKGDGPEYAFTIEIDAEAAGGIGLVPQCNEHAKSALLGYWLGEAHWGRGITTDAVRLLTDFAFGNWDLVRIYAEVFETNPASGRVLEKAGFQLEGRLRQHVMKDGKIMDSLLYGRLR